MSAVWCVFSYYKLYALTLIHPPRFLNQVFNHSALKQCPTLLPKKTIYESTFQGPMTNSNETVVQYCINHMVPWILSLSRPQPTMVPTPRSCSIPYLLYMFTILFRKLPFIRTKYIRVMYWIEGFELVGGVESGLSEHRHRLWGPWNIASLRLSQHLQ